MYHIIDLGAILLYSTCFKMQVFVYLINHRCHHSHQYLAFPLIMLAFFHLLGILGLLITFLRIVIQVKVEH